MTAWLRDFSFAPSAHINVTRHQSDGGLRGVYHLRASAIALVGGVHSASALWATADRSRDPLARNDGYQFGIT
jgi:hypothetical protein